jgi:hypothetical protein
MLASTKKKIKIKARRQRGRLQFFSAGRSSTIVVTPSPSSVCSRAPPPLFVSMRCPLTCWFLLRAEAPKSRNHTNKAQYMYLIVMRIYMYQHRLMHITKSPQSPLAHAAKPARSELGLGDSRPSFQGCVAVDSSRSRLGASRQSVTRCSSCAQSLVVLGTSRRTIAPPQLSVLGFGWTALP